ncbi:SRPBCC family protein [Saccharothrix syringae]|uniref:hypothetical protein n=1 Tax=Saccharothrix syringae TaxID=103733 RepID=UPI0006895F92|nr:hypothetical protein [Saccharothrix syringae]
MLGGEFEVGAAFSWETHGLSVTSAVYEVEPLWRTCWGGAAQEIEQVHVWTFSETGSGSVVVTTEESVEGVPRLT